ncbi:hypothetical protein BAZSYMA_ACONTIG102750_0 [Bathymodiolus azoricus thioautotrophic gill symbiont]|uniref:Uncharacterized protein n=1 Tax=Bathymodiolus azoricus thioautotrophic gill symbiont TaxID=235205 RepID=A0A1H6LJ94_9GAMM|nr:hypothetical protein BAZSYMA_ACONTIG102750_0 [Bathymodiolus azoricus thioautotrophic gill symbiont]
MAIDKLRTASPPPVYLISTEPTCPATITLLMFNIYHSFFL